MVSTHKSYDIFVLIARVKAILFSNKIFFFLYFLSFMFVHGMCVRVCACLCMRYRICVVVIE